MDNMVHKRPLAEQIAFPGLVEHYMSRIWQHDGEINSVVESCACDPAVSFPDNQARPRALEGLPFLVKGLPNSPTISVFLSNFQMTLFFCNSFRRRLAYEISSLFLDGSRRDWIDRHFVNVLCN